MAQAQQNTVTVTEVGTWPVDGFEGHEARILTVEVPVGQHAPVHLRPGSQYIWVARGTVTSRLEGEEARTFTAGDAWYEPRERRHVEFGNDGDTDAQVVVFYVTEPGRPVLTFAGDPG
jgi:quercetin dioxygenase-like cupin family protein